MKLRKFTAGLTAGILAVSLCGCSKKSFSLSDDSKSSIVSANIPDGVTEIGEWAFYECDRLTSVTIPDSVTEIGEGAFAYCENIIVTYKGQTYDYENIWYLYKAING